METFKRTCIKDWEVTDDEGNHFKVEAGKEYLTSGVDCSPHIGPEPIKDHVVVFTKFWVPVPIDNFSDGNRCT